MIAAISPASSNYEETLTTLIFANRVAVIKTDSTANVDEEAEMKVALLSEIEKLRHELDDVSKKRGPGEVIEEWDDEEIEVEEGHGKHKHKKKVVRGERQQELEELIKAQQDML